MVYSLGGWCLLSEYTVERKTDELTLEINETSHLQTRRLSEAHFKSTVLRALAYTLQTQYST